MSPDCEGPGCARPATWQRVSTLVANIEEYLCDDHYLELARDWPSTAAHYEPLDESLDDTAYSS